VGCVEAAGATPLWKLTNRNQNNAPIAKQFYYGF